MYAKYLNKDQIEELPIYYIAGSQTLPPPLEPAEEEEALKKLANGDEDIKKTNHYYWNGKGDYNNIQFVNCYHPLW